MAREAAKDQTNQLSLSPAGAKPAPAASERELAPEGPEFFIVCTPGFEDLTETEIRGFLPDAELRRERGGVTVFTSIGNGFELNRVLKTPSRILVRLARFGCRDFPKLFKKISNFPWEEWIADDAQIEFQAAAHQSRLKMKKRIEETCADGRKANLKKRGLKVGSGRSISVLIRLDNDVATLSLDTSGELLHKRGERELAAEAPLRETTASALLTLLERLGPVASAELVDPMTGGGTFLLEAARWNVRNDREYAYQHFLRKEKASLSTGAGHTRFEKLIGFEQDAKALQSARGNLKETGAELINADFFSAEPLPAASVERWLIVNPPYGERLKVEGKLSDFYERLMAASERVARPDRACFLLPEKVRPQSLKAPRGWKKMEARRFLNGGLPVVAMIFSVERRP